MKQMNKFIFISPLTFYKRAQSLQGMKHSVCLHDSDAYVGIILSPHIHQVHALCQINKKCLIYSFIHFIMSANVMIYNINLFNDYIGALVH